MLSEHSSIHITVKFPCKFKIIDRVKSQLLPQLKLNHWFPGGKVTSLAKLLQPKISEILSRKIKSRKEIFWFPEYSSEKQDGKRRMKDGIHICVCVQPWNFLKMKIL